MMHKKSSLQKCILPMLLIIIGLSIFVFAADTPGVSSISYLDKTYNNITINISWTHSDNAHNYTIKTYDYDGESIYNETILVTNYSNNSISIPQIRNGQSYMFEIIAINGTSTFSEQYIYTAPTGFYSALTNVFARATAENKLNISWTIPDYGTTVTKNDLYNISIIRGFDGFTWNRTVFVQWNNSGPQTGFFDSMPSFTDNEDGLNVSYNVTIRYKNQENYTTQTSGIVNSAPRILLKDAITNRTGDFSTLKVIVNDSSTTLKIDYIAEYNGSKTSGSSFCVDNSINQTCLVNITENSFSPVVIFVKDLEINFSGNITETSEISNLRTNFSSPTSKVTAFFSNARPTISGTPLISDARIYDGYMEYTCNYNYADEDLDIENNTLRTIKWFIKESEASTYSLYAAHNDKNLTNPSFNTSSTDLKCEVTVHDGEISSLPKNSSVFEGSSSHYFPRFSSASITATNKNELTLNWSFEETSAWGMTPDINISAVKNFTIKRNEAGLNFQDSNYQEVIQNSYFIDNQSLTAGLTYDYTLTILYDNGEQYTYPEGGAFSSLVRSSPNITNTVISFNRTTEEITINLFVTEYTNTAIATGTLIVSGEAIGSYNEYCEKQLGNNFTCSYTFEQVDVVAGDIIQIESTLYGGEDGSVFSTNNLFQATTPNARPEIFSSNGDAVSISNETYIDGSEEHKRLKCSYSYRDFDQDSITATEYEWFIQNEGIGTFNKVIGETSSTLEEPIFDNGDIIICSVRIFDATEWSSKVNSSMFSYSENLAPLIYQWNSSSSYEEPSQIGESIVFNAKVQDSDSGSNEEITIAFCRDDFTESNEIEETSIISIGKSNNSTDTLWTFVSSNGLPLSELRLKVNTIFNNSNTVVNLSEPIYDMYVYEANSFGQTDFSSSDIITKDENNILVGNNATNRFFFDNAMTNKPYYSIKVCINSDNDESANCDNTHTNQSFTFFGTSNTSVGKFIVIKNISESTQKNYSTTYVKTALGLDETTGECGDKTLCSISTIDINNNPEVSCTYNAKAIDATNQTYSIYAMDSNGKQSQIKTSNFYVNHPPYLNSNPTILKLNLSNPGEFISSGNYAETNQSLSCDFTVLDEDQYWENSVSNYSIKWFFKHAGNSTYSLCDNTNICPSGTSINLSYAITTAGDKWICQVTPKDQYTNGTSMNSSELTIIDTISGDTGTNKPTINTLLDTSNSGSIIYPGDTLNITITFRDSDSTLFNIYVCEGNDVETQNIISTSGCLSKELFRETGYSGNYGINENTFSFIIPNGLQTGSDYSINYTTFICDDTQCSNGWGDTLYTKSLREIHYINIRNATNNATFLDNIATTDDNLLCNFSFTDSTGITYTQENISSISSILDISWYKNSSTSTYVKQGFIDQKDLSNIQTKIGEKWFCQISFTDTTDNQEVNATPVIIKDSTPNIGNTAPSISQFFVSNPNAIVDQGVEFTFDLFWNDAEDDDVLIYVCNSSRIVATGCLDSTFVYTQDFTANSPTQLAHTFTSKKSNALSAYAKVCDDTYSCSNVKNFNITINNKPTVENVSIQEISEDGDYECNFDYVSNDNTNDFNATNTKYTWYLSKNGVVSTVFTGMGSLYKTYNAASTEQGILYCEVLVSDTRGLSPSAYTRSENYVSLSNTEYSFEIFETPESVKTPYMIIKGFLFSETNSNVSNKNVTAYAFNNSFLDISPKSNLTKTFVNNNPALSETYLAVSANKNASLLYFAKTTDNFNKLNISDSYIGFENHYNTDYTYYSYSFIATPNYYVVSLNTPLLESVSTSEVVSIYDLQIVEGRFELGLPLYENELNYIKIVSEDGGEFIFQTPSVVDNTQPFINQSTVSEDLYLKRSSKVMIDLYDETALNLSNLFISVTYNALNSTNITYNETSNEFQYDNSTENNYSKIFDLDSTSTLFENGHIIFNFLLKDNLLEGDYIIQTNITDAANNYNSSTKTYQYKSNILEFSELFAKDSATNSQNYLKGSNMTIVWNVSANDWNNIDYASIALYKEVETNRTLIKTFNTNKTAIENKLTPVSNACYSAEVQLVSKWGEYSPISKTNCISYVPTQIIVNDSEIIDNITEENTTLRSNLVTIRFSINSTLQKLLNKSEIGLYQKKDGSSTLLSSKELKAEERRTTLSIASLVDEACYFAKITTVSTSGVIAMKETPCITYYENNNLVLKMTSEHFKDDVLYFNSDIDFIIQTNNANTWTYKFVDLITGEDIKPFKRTKVTTVISDKESINLTRNASLPETQYKLNITAVSAYGGNNISKEYLVIFDEKAPAINNIIYPIEIYNTDEIMLYANITEEYYIKQITIQTNKTGISETIPMSRTGYNSSSQQSFYKANLSHKGIQSDSTFYVIFNVSDYANNKNTSITYNINVLNRKPENSSTIPIVYWNKNATYAEFNFKNYITDKDNNSMNYSLTNNLDDGSYLRITKDTGIIYGTFRQSFTVTEKNITVNVTDEKGLSESFDVTIKPVLGNCEDYASEGRVTIGFATTCNPSSTSDSGSSTESSSGGSSGGSSSSGRSSGGGSASPSILRDDSYYRETLTDISTGIKRTIFVDAKTVAVEGVSIVSSNDVTYSVFEAKRLSNVPSGVSRITDTDVYQYFELKLSGLTQEKISDAKVNIRIAKDNTLNIGKTNAGLMRWEDGHWKEYSLTFTKEDSTYYYYISKVPGFSYWAVIKTGNIENDNVKTDDTNNNQETNPDIEKPTDNTQQTEIEVKTSDSIDYTNYIIYGLGIFGIIALVFGGIFALSRSKGSSSSANYGIENNFSDTQIETMKEENSFIKEESPLPAYIRRHIDKGIPKTEIRAALLNVGWTKEKVDNAFLEIEKEGDKKTINMDFVDTQLVKQVEALLEQNMTKTEIIEELLSRHIAENKVTANVNYAIALANLNHQVSSWVSQGYSLTDIKKHLVELKWPTITIYEVMKKYKK